MKISVRITIALLVAALLPLVVVGVWSIVTLRETHEVATETLEHANQVATDLSNSALIDLGQRAIRQQAESVAREIELYLALNPALDLSDDASLEADAQLAEIAVQTYGTDGYTAVFDQRSITHFHPNPDLIGEPLRDLAGQLPEFWAILSASLDGSPVDGYYDWQDPDGRIRAKYMSIVPVEDTPLRVASTTYIDEFSEPAQVIETELNQIQDQARDQLSRIQNQAHVQLPVILIVVALLTSVGAYGLGRRFTRPVRQLTDAATEIATGDLTTEPPASDLGELGRLADTFRQMTDNLSSLIYRVQGLSSRLSAATEQVTVTHRQHAAHADEQAEAISDASSAVQELASSAAHIADTAQQVVGAANETQANSEKGVAAMDDAARHLERIADSNEDAVAKVRELGTLAREIGQIMDLIEDIAAQTRIIAFNASIEASAAGAVGRRFAVVAGEVRNLAGDVAQSTEEIRDKVRHIQTTTNELIIASERESKEIDAGLALGNTMTHLLAEIHHSAQQTTQAAEQISFGTRQQRSATEQLLADLQSLATGAQTVAASSRETVAVMEDLVHMTQEVNQTIEHFTLPEEPPLAGEKPDKGE